MSQLCTSCRKTTWWEISRTHNREGEATIRTCTFCGTEQPVSWHSWGQLRAALRTVRRYREVPCEPVDFLPLNLGDIETTTQPLGVSYIDCQDCQGVTRHLLQLEQTPFMGSSVAYCTRCQFRTPILSAAWATLENAR